MIYLTPKIYIIKRMKKIIDEAIDQGEVLNEFKLIERIAKELREGGANFQTIESNIIESLEDLPFGISKFSIFTKFYKRKILIAFKQWEEYSPEQARIHVGQQLKIYKDDVINRTYEYMNRHDLNLSINQLCYISDRSYLSDLEHYVTDFDEEREFIKMHERQISKFLNIYKSDNPCYVIIGEEISIDNTYLSISDEVVNVTKILAVAYYGEAKDNEGRFIGTTITCVEGELVPNSDINIPLNRDIRINVNS